MGLGELALCAASHETSTKTGIRGCAVDHRQDCRGGAPVPNCFGNERQASSHRLQEIRFSIPTYLNCNGELGFEQFVFLLGSTLGSFDMLVILGDIKSHSGSAAEEGLTSHSKWGLRSTLRHFWATVGGSGSLWFCCAPGSIRIPIASSSFLVSMHVWMSLNLSVQAVCEPSTRC